MVFILCHFCLYMGMWYYIRFPSSAASAQTDMTKTRSTWLQVKLCQRFPHMLLESVMCPACSSEWQATITAAAYQVARQCFSTFHLLGLGQTPIV